MLKRLGLSVLGILLWMVVYIVELWVRGPGTDGINSMWPFRLFAHVESLGFTWPLVPYFIAVGWLIGVFAPAAAYSIAGVLLTMEIGFAVISYFQVAGFLISVQSWWAGILPDVLIPCVILLGVLWGRKFRQRMEPSRAI